MEYYEMKNRKSYFTLHEYSNYQYYIPDNAYYYMIPFSLELDQRDILTDDEFSDSEDERDYTTFSCNYHDDEDY